MDQFVVDGLRASLQDQVITAADAGYDEVRATFNATVSRRPAVIVQARTVDDVVAAVVPRASHQETLGGGCDALQASPGNR